MAVRGTDEREEKKSYGSAFVLGSALLVVLTLWAYWDDNITRRPWKQYQAQFYRLDYQKAKAAYDEEDKKLQADPAYQDLTKKLEAAQSSLAKGELRNKIDALTREETRAKVRFSEIDQQVKDLKSELEEAWYDHDHAVQTGGSAKPVLARIDELNKEKEKLDKPFEGARIKRDQLKDDIDKLNAGVKDLETQLAKTTAERDKWIRVMENATSTVKIGELKLFSFYKIPSIKQAVLPEFERNNFDEPVARVDRCQTCHLAINRPGFEKEAQPFRTHPNREVLLADNAHAPDRFGCTSCHEGQGPAVNSVKQAHGEVTYWEEPLLRGAKVQSNCVSCHLDVQPLKDAPLLAQGQRLFEQVGCTGCHLVKGYEDIPKIGPNLRRISAKVDPNWMVRWIENPHLFRPRTRMPNFAFKEDEAVAIASYLWSNSKQESEKWLADHPAPAGFREGDTSLVAQGKELTETIGCKGCHGFADGEFSTVLGEGKDVVPNLHNIAAKVSPQWIYNWVKNPRGYYAETRMPSLRLTEQEALAITAYLSTLGVKTAPIANLEGRLQDTKNISRGESLVRKYGCFGCHDIPGMEKESRIGVELTTFGSKSLEELFFGNHTDIPETWDDWTYNKLKTPRTYATERVEQLMPQFDLTDADIKSLRVVLAGFRDRKIPSRYLADHSSRAMQVVDGRRLMHQYNCIGCHEIEGQGGFIRKYYQESPTLTPPVLNGEGEKVQPPWLFSFLKSPVPIRPWLKLRMPTFGFSDQDDHKLVDFFTGLSKVQIPYTYVDDSKITKENLDAARLLVSKDYFNCFSCHQQGDKKPEGPVDGWAPDLTLARQRLNPNWIIKWIQDPQKIQPGAKMPSFYPGGPDNILGGKEDLQIEALRDYLMSIGRGAASPAPAASASAAKAKPVK